MWRYCAVNVRTLTLWISTPYSIIPKLLMITTHFIYASLLFPCFTHSSISLMITVSMLLFLWMRLHCQCLYHRLQISNLIWNTLCVSWHDCCTVHSSSSSRALIGTVIIICIICQLHCNCCGWLRYFIGSIHSLNQLVHWTFSFIVNTVLNSTGSCCCHTWNNNLSETVKQSTRLCKWSNDARTLIGSCLLSSLDTAPFWLWYHLTSYTKKLVLLSVCHMLRLLMGLL